jgi:hypothetical protein
VYPGVMFDKKTRGQKSRETVPLRSHHQTAHITKQYTSSFWPKDVAFRNTV